MKLDSIDIFEKETGGKGKKKYSRKCPKCGKVLFYKTKRILQQIIKRKTTSMSGVRLV